MDNSMEQSVQRWLSAGARINTAECRMTQPVQVSCWTKESAAVGGGYLYGDSSGLLPLQDVSLPADLNEGYPDAYTPKEEGESTPVDPIIHAAIHASVDWAQVDVCSFRNNFNKIALTPINPDQPWTVDACLHSQGPGATMFLNIHKTPEAGGGLPPDTADRFTYYGYKFEALCTGDRASVDATSEYGTLLSYRLGGLSVLMAAEIDCHDGQGGEDPTAGFLELKTYRQPDHERQRTNMKRFKYPRWWVQSHLAGVRHLVLGARNDAGMLLQVHKKAVGELAPEARAVGAQWDPWVLLGCLHEMLAWMLSCTQANPNTHIVFSYIPSQKKVVGTVAASSSWPEHLQRLLEQE